jgi:hypothetical protein
MDVRSGPRTVPVQFIEGTTTFAFGQTYLVYCILSRSSEESRKVSVIFPLKGYRLQRRPIATFATTASETRRRSNLGDGRASFEAPSIPWEARN